jgi:hypothetical protein
LIDGFIAMPETVDFLDSGTRFLQIVIKFSPGQPELKRAGFSSTIEEDEKIRMCVRKHGQLRRVSIIIDKDT